MFFGKTAAATYKHAFKSLAPPPDLTVSEWADQFRRLPAESSAEPGQWYTSRAEYQRGIMDAITEPDVNEIVIMSSSQVGKSEIILNALGYLIDLDPCPIMLVQPRMADVEKFSKNRIAPMIRETPALRAKISDAKSRDSGNTIHEKRFPGGRLVMVGSNSPAGLAGDPIRVVLADEVDRYEESAGSEGDPINLVKKRMTTFFNWILIMVSTPGNKGESRIEAAFELSDKRRYFVTCPDCNEDQYLKWSQVKWNDGDPETALYACEHCGSLWNDADRWGLVKEGEWRATAEFNGRAGFHLNEIYSPWVKLSEIVAAFIEAKGNKEMLKTWVNTSLGETFEEKGETVDSDTLLSRVEDYDRESLPSGIYLLTCGVDVQNDRLECLVIGHGVDGELWRVELQILPGNPNTSEIWIDLDEFLTSIYPTDDGRELKIEATCIDTGGHSTQAVYQYAARHKRKRRWAIKGIAGEGKPILSKTPSFSAKSRSTPFYLVGVDAAKELIYGRLNAVTEPGPGYIHFDSTMDQERIDQLTGEKVITTFKKGKPTRAWLATQKRLEELDCFVYAMAAFIGRQIDVNRRASRMQKPKEAPKTEPNPPKIDGPVQRGRRKQRAQGGFAYSWR